MGPIRTGNKSDAEDGGELVRAPLNAKLGFQAQKWGESSEGCVLGRGGLHAGPEVGLSSWQSDQLVWGAGQAETGQSR